MKVNKKLRDTIIQIVENQINSNEIPETKITFERLKKEGHNDIESKKLIGTCLTIELSNIMEHNLPFNEERYIKNLKELPKLPK